MTSKDIYLVAANRELNSYHFYLSLAEIHPSGEARDLLHRMAQEELKHKEKMEYLYANTAFPRRRVAEGALQAPVYQRFDQGRRTWKKKYP
jgi:rubrerythrin